MNVHSDAFYFRYNDKHKRLGLWKVLYTMHVSFNTYCKHLAIYETNIIQNTKCMINGHEVKSVCYCYIINATPVNHCRKLTVNFTISKNTFTQHWMLSTCTHVTTDGTREILTTSAVFIILLKHYWLFGSPCCQFLCVSVLVAVTLCVSTSARFD